MKTQKCYQAKPGEVQQKWHVIDLDGVVLGRAATRIATILRGKHRPQYTPHVDCGDFVIAINAHKVKLTGNKESEKYYYRHSEFPGGLKSNTAAELRAIHPEDIIKLAVKGMVPKGPLGYRQLNKLKVYASAEHPHQAQNPEPLSL